jgi:hypothetical protein
MRRQVQSRPSRRYLTDDEIVELCLRGEPCRFRLRVWRNESGPAIVLASQVNGGPSPSLASSPLANLAYQAYLGFSSRRMINFEDQLTDGEQKLFLLEFVSFGHDFRRCLTQPSRRPFHWIDLEAMVGGAIR